MSSSWAKPCTHHTVAVLASALAIKGRPIPPAAASPADARKTDRLVSVSISSLLVQSGALLHAASIRSSGEYAPPGGAVQLLTTAWALHQGYSRATFQALIGHPHPQQSFYYTGGLSASGPIEETGSDKDPPALLSTAVG